MDFKQNANATRWTLFPKYHSGYVSFNSNPIISAVNSLFSEENSLVLLLVRWTSPLNPVLISPQTFSIENKTKTINFFGMSLHRAVTGKMGINRPTQGFSPLCPQPATGKRLKATLEKHVVTKHNVLSSVFIFSTLFDILWHFYTGNRRRKNGKHIITYE